MSRPPLVVHAIDTLRTGGAQWVLGALVEGLAGAGLTRNVVVAGTADRADPILLARLDACADRVEILDSHRLADPALLAGIVRALRGERPALLHTHLVGTNVNGRIAARLARVPHVATVHTAPGGAEDTPGRRWADGLTARLSRRIVVPSAAVGEAYRTRWRVPSGRITVIPNPVPSRVPRAGARAAVRRELAVADDELLVLCLARLEPQKGVDVLLDAARGLPGRVRVAVAGDGPERDRLEGPASEAGVRMLGHRADVADLLAASDLVCLPSRHEALPLTLLEAMAAGVPVVASAVGGVPELLEGGAGALVHAGDAPGLRDALCALAGDPAARERFAAGGAARVAARHSPAVVAAAHAALYCELRRGAVLSAGARAHRRVARGGP